MVDVEIQDPNFFQYSIMNCEGPEARFDHNRSCHNGRAKYNW
jgi:hypothetical protein